MRCCVHTTVLLLAGALVAFGAETKTTLFTQKTEGVDADAGIQGSVAEGQTGKLAHQEPGMQSTVISQKTESVPQTDAVKTEVGDIDKEVVAGIHPIRARDVEVDGDNAGIQSTVGERQFENEPHGVMLRDEPMSDDSGEEGRVMPHTGQIVADPETNLGGAVVADEVAKSSTGGDLNKDSGHTRMRRWNRYGGGYGGNGYGHFGGYGHHGGFGSYGGYGHHGGFGYG